MAAGGGRSSPTDQAMRSRPRGSPPSDVGGNGAWVLSTGGAAAGSEGYLVTRTLDRGAHWQTVLGQLGGAAGAMSTIDAYAGSFDVASASAAGFIGFCPACGYGDWSYTRTADGGRTFTHTPLAGLTGASLGDLTFADPAHGWIAGSAAGGFLLATTDGGRTWHRAYPFSTPWPALDVALVSPSVGFGLGVIGDGRAILRTDDGGRTWQAIGRLQADQDSRPATRSTRSSTQSTAGSRPPLACWRRPAVATRGAPFPARPPGESPARMPSMAAPDRSTPQPR